MLITACNHGMGIGDGEKGKSGKESEETCNEKDCFKKGKADRQGGKARQSSEQEESQRQEGQRREAAPQDRRDQEGSAEKARGGCGRAAGRKATTGPKATGGRAGERSAAT